MAKVTKVNDDIRRLRALYNRAKQLKLYTGPNRIESRERLSGEPGTLAHARAGSVMT